jgi:hypothetical protein
LFIFYFIEFYFVGVSVGLFSIYQRPVGVLLFRFFSFFLRLTGALTPCRPALGFAGWAWAAWTLSALLGAFFHFILLFSFKAKPRR